MAKSNRISLLLMSLIIFLNPGVINARQEEQPKKQKTFSPITPIDQLVDECKSQLYATSNNLSLISKIISDNTANTVPKHKSDLILKHIRSLNGFISMLDKEKFAIVDLETVYGLLRCTRKLNAHIIELVDTNFKEIQDLDKEEYSDKRVKQELQKYNNAKLDGLLKSIEIRSKTVEPEKVIALLLHNERQIKRLTKKSDSFGIQWYNRAYRLLDDYIISPCTKKSVPRRAFIIGGSTFMGLYTWKWLWMKHYRAHAPSFIKSFFGVNEISSSMTGYKVMRPGKKEEESINDEVRESLSFIERTEIALGEILNNLLPIPKLMCEGLIFYGGYEYKTNQKKLKKKLIEWNNWLRGGSHLREAQRVSDHVEKVFFKDIVGQKAIVEYFTVIRDYLAGGNTESMDRLGLTPPKGILCVGDTRTGKTFAVTALFNEIMEMLKKQGNADKYKFITLSATEINYCGIEALLTNIKKSAPCIVFIDEIDLLGLQRDSENAKLSEFLQALSGVVDSKDTKNQVIIIAATNRPENLDVALRQPGRFGKELRFEYPNLIDRKKFIIHKLDKLSLDYEAFDVDKIAKQTHNRSYEAVKMVIDNALLRSRMQGEILDQKHIEQALDEDVYHITQANTKQIPSDEQQILAAHFAGQALALSLLDCNAKLSKVTLKQVMTDIKEEMMGMHLWGEKDKKEQKRFEYGKIFIHYEQDSINMNSKDEKLKLCQMYLAGFAAEEILLGACSYSCHAEDDKANALNYAQSLAFEGLDIEKLPKHIKNKRYDAAFALLDQCKQQVKQLLEEHKDALQKISDALLEKKILTAQEIVAIIENQQPSEK